VALIAIPDVERADRRRLGRARDRRALLRRQARDIGADQRLLLGHPHHRLPRRGERGLVDAVAQPTRELRRDHRADGGNPEQAGRACDRIVDPRGDPGVLLVGVGEHRRGQRRDGRR
jgi:hypothetical protein